MWGGALVAGARPAQVIQQAGVMSVSGVNADDGVDGSASMAIAAEALQGGCD
jgi:hypothetical protein